MPKVVCPWGLITDFVVDAFAGYGVPRDEAEMCADVLLESDKRGIESHGCNRFKPVYLDRIKAGIQSPTTNFEIIKEMYNTGAKNILILTVFNKWCVLNGNCNLKNDILRFNSKIIKLSEQFFKRRR